MENDERMVIDRYRLLYGDRIDKVIGKVVVIHLSAVSDRAIDDFDLRPEHGFPLFLLVLFEKRPVLE